MSRSALTYLALTLWAIAMNAPMALAKDLNARAGGAPESRGAQVYRQTCQGCHLREGQGAQGAGNYPALAGNPRLVAWEYVAITILNGRNAMPRFGVPAAAVQPLAARTYQLSDAEIAAVVNYVTVRFGHALKGRVTEAEIAVLPHPTSLLRP